MSLDKISSIFNESGRVAVTDWGMRSVSCLFHIFCGQTFPRHTQGVLLFFLQDTHKWCYYFFNTGHARLASLVTLPSLHPLKMYAAKQTQNVEFTGQKKCCRSKISLYIQFQTLKCPLFIPQLGELIRENLTGSLLKGSRSNFEHLSVPCLSHSLENLSEKIRQAHCSKAQGQLVPIKPCSLFK